MKLRFGVNWRSLATGCGLLVLSACHTPDGPHPREATVDQRAFVRAFIRELITRGTAARLEDYTTADLTITILPNTPEAQPVVIQGREAFRERRQASLQKGVILAEEDIQVVSGEGGLAAWRSVTSKDLQTAQLQRRAQMAFYTFRDGRIASLTLLYGPATVQASPRDP